MLACVRTPTRSRARRYVCMLTCTGTSIGTHAGTQAHTGMYALTNRCAGAQACARGGASVSTCAPVHLHVRTLACTCTHAHRPDCRADRRQHCEPISLYLLIHVRILACTHDRMQHTDTCMCTRTRACAHTHAHAHLRKHTCMTHLHGTPARHTCTAHLYDTPARHTCTAHLHDTSARHTSTACRYKVDEDKWQQHNSVPQTKLLGGIGVCTFAVGIA